MVAWAIYVKVVVDSPTSPTLVGPFFGKKGVCPSVQLIDPVKCLLTRCKWLILLVWLTAYFMTCSSTGITCEDLRRVFSGIFHISLILWHKESFRGIRR